MRDKILLVLFLVLASVLCESVADARPAFRRQLQADHCDSRQLRQTNRPRQGIFFGPLGIPRRIIFTD